MERQPKYSAGANIPPIDKLFSVSYTDFEFNKKTGYGSRVKVPHKAVAVFCW